MQQPRRKIQLTSSKNPERTSGGLVGKIAGRAKEVAGEALKDDQLAREGRLQQSQVDSEQEARNQAADARRRDAEAELEREKVETRAERERLENELTAKTREEAAERDRREAEKLAEERSASEVERAEKQKASALAHASQIEREAEEERQEGKHAAARLEEKARRAEATADTIDPKENN
jgi:uncharacterized protein YjbJ (UPF0337 family)